MTSKKGFTKAVIAAKEGGREANLVAEQFTELLLSSGFDVMAVAPLLIKGVPQIRSLTTLKTTGSDILVSVGGDGTLLKAVRESDARSPVLGINVGGRGALAQVDRSELKKAIKLLSKGSYTLESRLRLCASAASEEFAPATNDIFLSRVPLDRTPTFTIISLPFRVQHRMDGLIVSTATGSTGHSLFMGGPIVHEALNAFVLTPIASLNGLTSLVLPHGTVEVTCDFPLHIVIDGQKVSCIKANTLIRVKADKPVTFVKLEGIQSSRLSSLESKRRMQ